MSSKSRFDRKTAKKYAVVHRPHDDPQFYDADASAHVLVPVDNPNKSRDLGKVKSPLARTVTGKIKSASNTVSEHVGEAAKYGILFDDSNYDYTKHLKPIGEDPDAVFIPAKGESKAPRKQNIEDMIVEPKYKSTTAKAESVFQRGMAKPEYLIHQQDVEDELRGFKPDMNPALREVLEALEDEAYVVNEDIVVGSEKVKPSSMEDDAAGDDDIFAELLGSGRVEDEEDFEQEFDEWDMDNLENFEDDNYQEELQQFDKIENLEDLQHIDYQADVGRFKKEQSRKYVSDDWDSDNDLESDGVAASSDEERDGLGELPSINMKQKGQSSNKKKHRRKKGAMSDVSGFSMSSSAIARSEALTVLDDRYDMIISGYDNYEEEQELDEENNYKPFDMANERSDFESLLDDFLDNYELEKGGRKLAKKDKEIDRIKMAADEVSKGKLSMRRKREAQKNAVDNLSNGLSSLRF